ncbi:hypothetical protein E0E52_18085 [Azotobacter chroococcum]|uniref:hypothetical protein n=1 Tax=Azotobacter chroococcum TaxID=353 RepID=UPI001039CCEF|nr:hypothetical protein [Azotobacter chroococcum]TBW02149.1 hypothetical protein E0E52_18085 [Azotobacter chroococcum]
MASKQQLYLQPIHRMEQRNAGKISSSILIAAQISSSKPNTPSSVSTEPAALEKLKLTENSVTPIRLLVQAQTLALDKTPSEQVKRARSTDISQRTDNVTLKNLCNSAEFNNAKDSLPGENLKNRFDNAFKQLNQDNLEYRSERFAEIHQLITDIAKALSKQTAADKQGA